WNRPSAAARPRRLRRRPTARIPSRTVARNASAIATRTGISRRIPAGSAAGEVPVQAGVVLQQEVETDEVIDGKGRSGGTSLGVLGQLQRGLVELLLVLRRVLVQLHAC